MAVITPVGKEFDWSPKDQELVKAASASKTQPKSDKDLLYEAAKKVVTAQFMNMDKPVSMDGGVEAPCGSSDGGAPSDSIDGIGEGIGESIGEGIGDAVKDVSSPEGAEGLEGAEVGEIGEIGEGEEGGEGSASDVQQAVKELVEKADKAEEIASKVQDAVGKVEEAVEEVKSVIGEGLPEEIEIEIGDVGEEGGEEGGESDDKEEKEEGKPFGKKEDKEEHEEKETPEKEEKEEEIVQESSTKKPQMKSSAAYNDLVPLASLSPSVKKKVYDYYKNDLKYAPDYCKLLVQDN